MLFFGYNLSKNKWLLLPTGKGGIPFLAQRWKLGTQRPNCAGNKKKIGAEGKPSEKFRSATPLGANSRWANCPFVQTMGFKHHNFNQWLVYFGWLMKIISDIYFNILNYSKVLYWQCLLLHVNFPCWKIPSIICGAGISWIFSTEPCKSVLHLKTPQLDMRINSFRKDNFKKILGFWLCSQRKIWHLGRNKKSFGNCPCVEISLVGAAGCRTEPLLVSIHLAWSISQATGATSTWVAHDMNSVIKSTSCSHLT